ncbi:MAG: RNA polymerase sigma factor [Sandaracinaceae bacterium]|nr:RNA polymerase sigma factor [Sandaracinaceae bacterium]
MTSTSSTDSTPTITAATIRELEPVLLGYARKRISNEELARDLVQETWLAAMVSLPRFAGRSSLRTWVISILRRKIVDQYRRSRPQVAFIEEAHGEVEGVDVVAHMDDMAAMTVLARELHTLHGRERDAVTLVDVEGVDRDDAATELGVTRNHLRVLLHRGRAQLRGALEAADYARAA